MRLLLIAMLVCATVAYAGVITDSATVGSSSVAGIQSQINSSSADLNGLDTDLGRSENNVLANGFRISINGALTAYDLDDGWTDQFEDQSGVDTGGGSNYTYDADGDYYSYSANSAVIPENLAVFYNMEDNTNTTTVTDEFGSQNGDAQANTSTKSTTGKIGNAITFNGSTDYVTCPELDETFGNSVGSASFSMCAWVALDDYNNPAASDAVWAMGDADNQPAIYSLFRLQSPAGGWRFLIQDDDGHQMNAQYGVDTGWTDGTWHHVAGVWNVSEKAGYLYLDGVLAAAATNAATDTFTDFSSADVKGIGLRSQGASTQNWLTGDLDMFMLYTNRALTGSDIAAIYNSGVGKSSFGTVDGTSEIIATNVLSATTAPTNGRLVVAHEDVTGTATAGTDFKGYISSDNGSTWDEVTFGSSLGELSSGVDLWAGTNVITSGGTDMLWRLTTEDDTKAGRFHAVGVLWKE